MTPARSCPGAGTQDADSDRLTAAIDYSRDGGRTWTVVAGDIRGRSARIGRRALGASGNARIRVHVSDGFDAALAESGRLRPLGAPPLVRIESRPRGSAPTSSSCLRAAPSTTRAGR